MLGRRKKEEPETVTMTVSNDQVEATISERGEPQRRKPHGPNQTVLYYGVEDANERQSDGLHTPAELLARESRAGLMVPDTMAQTTAQGLREREERNTVAGRPMNQPDSRAYRESIAITERRLQDEGQATSTAEPTSVPVEPSTEALRAKDEALVEFKDQIKPLGGGKFEVSDTLGNVVDTVDGIEQAIALARQSKV